MTDTLNFGKHKGTPLPEVPTAYLLYLLALDNVRQSRPASVAAMLRELARRLTDDFEATADELARPTFPPRSPAEISRSKAQQRADKLAKVEARRGAEQAAKRLEWDARRAALRKAELEAEQAKRERYRQSVVFDAHVWKYDGSDLV
jgi:hypothetical protein